ncbi:MAG: cyclic nucleotide-binding domain-containing protein [Anaeromyxobacter sp.]
MADLRKLKDKAAEYAEKGKLDKAAKVYAEVLEADPDDVNTRQKRADVLRRAERLKEAIAEYAIVAERFGKDGLLIKAIAICKTILELDAAHVETQSALAGLYAARSASEAKRPQKRATLFMAAVRPEPPPPAPAPPPEAEAPEEIVSFKLQGTPPPPERGFPPPVVKFIPPPGPVAPPPIPTPLARISLVAQKAVDDGIVEDIEIDDLEADVIEDVELVPAEDVEPLEAPVPTGVLPLAAKGAPPKAAAPPPAAAPPEVELELVPEGDEPPPAVPEEPVLEPEVAPTADEPAPLPHIPIFSDLSKDAFVALTAGMVLHRFGEGDVILREGEQGTSFYVLASGALAVTKRDDKGHVIPLAKLAEGDFFGEMAILSGAARAATVTAEVASEVLEFPADVLLAIAKHHPHMATSLRKFYRQRLLANAMAVSPIFRPFGKGDRKIIMERFLAREAKPGDVVIREGVPSDGLYVILEGSVEVRKLNEGAEVVVGELREGDLFGEMSCLRKTPATATCVVKRRGTLLRLPRRDFDMLVLTYPQILELVSELSDERLENLDAILSGHAEWTDEGLVLV